MNSNAIDSVGGAVFGWWISYIHANTGAARKSRAQIRRASRPSEVLAIEATHELHSKFLELGLQTNFKTDGYPLRLALVAAVIAGIDESTQTSIPASLGRKSDDKRAMSELRFQRIMSASEDWELANRLRRSLPIVKLQTNVSIAGEDLFYWGEKVRNRWCFQYFGSRHPNDSEHS